MTYVEKLTAYIDKYITVIYLLGHNYNDVNVMVNITHALHNIVTAGVSVQC